VEKEIPQNVIGKVRSWSEMQIYLSDDLEPSTIKLLRSYTRAQIDITMGRRRRAKQLLNILDRRFGLEDCEEKNPDCFRIVDIAIRGETNRDYRLNIHFFKFFNIFSRIISTSLLSRVLSGD
jgi:hypothetical protein